MNFTNAHSGRIIIPHAFRSKFRVTSSATFNIRRRSTLAANVARYVPRIRLVRLMKPCFPLFWRGRDSHCRARPDRPRGSGGKRVPKLSRALGPRAKRSGKMALVALDNSIVRRRDGPIRFFSRPGVIGERRAIPFAGRPLIIPAIASGRIYTARVLVDHPERKELRERAFVFDFRSAPRDEMSRIDSIKTRVLRSVKDYPPRGNIMYAIPLFLSRRMPHSRLSLRFIASFSIVV